MILTVTHGGGGRGRKDSAAPAASTGPQKTGTFSAVNT